MSKTNALRGLLLLAAAIPLCLFARSASTVATATPVELKISGPKVIHAGDNLPFTATLTNRSGHAIAVPSIEGNGWAYVGVLWNITRLSGQPLAFKPNHEIPIDNVRAQPTFHDRDFVILKPGEKVDYQRESIGDPSDVFLFPGNGRYLVTLSWSFCGPKATPFPNDGLTAYSCGVTTELSLPVREAVLATPSFEAHSKAWQLELK